MIQCVKLCVLFGIFVISLEAINPSNVEVAINCGGSNFKSHDGIQYKKDENYKGGEASNFGTSLDIALTKDQELYKTERWNNENFSYYLPMKSKSGKFVLILKFSEVYFDSKDEKVFDVQLGDSKILANVDIYAKVGKAAAYDEFIPFEIKDGSLYVKNEKVQNAYDADKGVLKLSFIKKERDNPKVNAILIVKGTIDDTNYKEYQEMKEIMEKKKSEKERKEREFHRQSKSIDFEDFEDDFVDDGRKYQSNVTFFSFPSIALSLVVIGLAYYLFFGKERK